MPSPNFPNELIREVSPRIITTNSFYPQYDTSNPPLLRQISSCLLAAPYYQHVFSRHSNCQFYIITPLRCFVANCTISKGGATYYHVHYLPTCMPQYPKDSSQRLHELSALAQRLQASTTSQLAKDARTSSLLTRCAASKPPPLGNSHRICRVPHHETQRMILPNTSTNSPSTDYYFICICPQVPHSEGSFPFK